MMDLTDAEINQRLAEALGHYEKPLTEHEINQALADARPYVKNGCVFWRLNGNKIAFSVMELLTPKKLWDRREGAPYQADIEAHVAAYRRTPPNWAGNLATAFTLGGEIQKRDLAPQFINALAEQIYCEPFWSIHIDELVLLEVCHATPRQRALAALRTLEEAKDV